MTTPVIGTNEETNYFHPALDWSKTRVSSTGRRQVETTCLVCGSKRWEDWASARYRIRAGNYTGVCKKDRLLGRATAPRLAHPCVDWSDTVLVTVGKKRFTRVAVTCPKCHEKRYAQPGALNQRIRKGNLSGECLKCSKNAPKREWRILSPGRKLDPIKGYVRVSLSAVEPAHHHLWHAMKIGSVVLEHRLVMAMTLGRPLKSNELVDHIDGNKLNNDPSNLRLYVRGRNQPGDTSGYGTFYDEWQRAEAEIRRLRALLG